MKFAHAQENDQLKSISLDDKKLQNWPAWASLCNNENIGERRPLTPRMMIRASSMIYKVMIFVRSMSLIILQEALGARKFSQSEQQLVIPIVLEKQVRPVLIKGAPKN